MDCFHDSSTDVCGLQTGGVCGLVPSLRRFSHRRLALQPLTGHGKVCCTPTSSWVCGLEPGFLMHTLCFLCTLMDVNTASLTQSLGLTIIRKCLAGLGPSRQSGSGRATLKQRSKGYFSVSGVAGSPSRVLGTSPLCSFCPLLGPSGRPLPHRLSDLGAGRWGCRELRPRWERWTASDAQTNLDSETGLLQHDLFCPS